MSQKTLDLVVPNVIMMDLGDKELLIGEGGGYQRKQSARGGGGLESCCNSLTKVCGGLGDCAGGYLKCLFCLD